MAVLVIQNLPFSDYAVTQSNRIKPASPLKRPHNLVENSLIMISAKPFGSERDIPGMDGRYRERPLYVSLWDIMISDLFANDLAVIWVNRGERGNIYK
jgi:hypothetical protein